MISDFAPLNFANSPLNRTPSTFGPLHIDRMTYLVEAVIGPSDTNVWPMSCIDQSDNVKENFGVLLYKDRGNITASIDITLKFLVFDKKSFIKLSSR